jgi:hypothetical protein
MSLRQRDTLIVETPFSFLASAACQQVPLMELQIDPHAIRKRYDVWFGKVGFPSRMRGCQLKIKRQTQALSDLSSK